MSLPGLVLLCLAITVALMAVMALAFLRSPEAGFRLTTHRLEQLPLVMADRYVAFGLLALGMMVWGNLPSIALLFGTGAFMGLADGAIYARAGHSHLKHTVSGLMSAGAMCITFYFLLAHGTT